MTRIVLLFLLLGLMASCSSNKKPRPNPNIPPKFAATEPVFSYEGDLQIVNAEGDTISQFKIEFADTPKKRELGLMNRKSMEEDQAMLFVFDREERQTFWMKDTDIALDLIFVNADMQIIHIAENCQPYSLEPIHSFEYAQYVLEVVGTYCAQNNIKIGDAIKFKKL